MSRPPAPRDDATPWTADPLAWSVLFALFLTVAQRGVGFIRGMLFCRMMSAEQLGQWSAIWSLLMLLAPLAALGLPGSFCRYSQHYLQRGQFRPYLRRVAAVSTLATLGLAAAMLVAPRAFSLLVFREAGQPSLVRTIAAVFVLVALFNAVQSLMESLQRVRIVSLMRFWNGVSFAVVAVGLLAVCENDTLAVVLGFGVSCGIGLIPAIRFFWGQSPALAASNQPLEARAMWARIAPFAASIWLSNLLTNSYESIDRFMLLHLLPTGSAAAQAELGQYHSSLVLPQLLVGLAVVLSGTLLPYLSAAWERRDYDEARAVLRWTLKAVGIGFTLASLALLAAAPLLFRGILAGRYVGGESILPITLVYCFWFSLVTCAQNALWCSERIKLAALALAIGLLCNAGLNALFIPRWGLHGAVAATAIAHAVCLASLLALIHRQGWHVDRGTIVVAALPLIVLLGVGPALLSAALLAWGIARYAWVFNASEKEALRAAALRGLRPKGIGPRLAWSPSARGRASLRG